MRIVSVTPPPGPRTTRADWVQLALEILVSQGVEKLKVLNLAQGLGVSRSSFYWFFKSRRDLLDHLLEYWEQKNTSGLIAHACLPAGSITEAILNVFECWVDENVYDPRLDFAIREWARRSKPVRRLVQEADEQRVQALTEMYQRYGYADQDAFIRARILYFMQVGYYALDMGETMEIRLSYIAAYLRGFSGEEPSAAEIQRFRTYALNHANAATKLCRR